MTPIPEDRLAAAPISWGVCEVPGWGHQLGVDRVLREMRDTGFAATELGPDGFLPDRPTDKAAVLRRYGMHAVGGFMPVVLHQPEHDPLPGLNPVIEGLVAAGADVLVLAAATGGEGYDTRAALDDAAWTLLLGRLDAVRARAAAHGVRTVLHPHVGTLVEHRDDVRRVLAGSAVPLCLDTGHLLLGGTDPAALAREIPDRIGHVHLKDVDAEWARRLREGGTTYTEAVRGGLYRPLGDGDVDVAGVVEALEDAGYDGWYVLEQDRVLDGDTDAGAALADVRSSLAYLRGEAG